MAAKSIMEDEIRRTIGSGADTYVWDDVWLPTSPAWAPKPKTTRVDKDLKVHHLIEYDTKEWNVDLIHELIVA